MTRKRVRRTQVLKLPSGHRLAFVGDRLVSLDHADIQREVVLAELGGSDYVADCDCAQRFLAAMRSLGCQRPPKEDNPHHENVTWNDNFPQGLRQFRYKERALQWRMARAWRKRYNKLNLGRRVREWWPKDAHPVVWRYLNFPMCVLKELRQRGHEAVREGLNNIELKLGPEQPSVAFRFYLNGEREGRQTWTFNAALEAYRLAGRTVQFNESAATSLNGDLVVVQVADALEEMCLSVYRLKQETAIMNRGLPNQTRGTRRRAGQRSLSRE